MTLRFADIAEPRPTREGLASSYETISATLDRGDRATALAAWDQLRRRYDTWSALVHLRFAQDTTDETAKAERDYADALSPEAADLEIALKRRLLAAAAVGHRRHHLRPGYQARPRGGIPAIGPLHRIAGLGPIADRRPDGEPRRPRPLR